MKLRRPPTFPALLSDLEVSRFPSPSIFGVEHKSKSGAGCVDARRFFSRDEVIV